MMFRSEEVTFFENGDPDQLVAQRCLAVCTLRRWEYERVKVHATISPEPFLLLPNYFRKGLNYTEEFDV